MGVAVILECSASSKSGSNPKITWYKNGKTILPSPNGRYFQMRVTNFFFFLKTVVDDTGTYTCVASNDAGEIRASMFLRVRSQIMVGKFFISDSRQLKQYF